MADQSTSPTSFEALNFFEAFEKHAPSSMKPIEHENVGVLLLSFDKNYHDRALDVSEETQALEDVFRNEYNFDVSNKVIRRGDNAHTKALKYLADFNDERSNKKHSLTIVYYGGHGWRSTDSKREMNRRFNLTSEQARRGVPPPEGTHIRWEIAEEILHGSKSDVLIIFDCCDAGYLSKRGAAFPFEYLVACEDNEWTHRPGDSSFTSALIWALKELKDLAPFTTKDLLAKIKTHNKFPEAQEPKSFPRWDGIMEPVWLSPIRPVSGRLRSSSNAPEFRSEEQSYVDVRLYFNQRIGTEHAQDVANLLHPAVYDTSRKLKARRVSVVNKGKVMTEKWRRARNRLSLARNIEFMQQRSSSTLGTQGTDEEQSPQGPRKRLKLNIAEEAEERLSTPEPSYTSQRLITPMSEDPRSETGPRVNVHLGPGATPSVDVSLSLENCLDDPSDVQGALIREIQSLDKPDLENLLLQIRKTKRFLDAGS